MILNIFIGWRKGLVLSATFFAALLFVTSCKKKDNLLGGNAIDQGELLESGGVDTFLIKSYTEKADSIITSNARYALLGNYMDPEFGSVKSSFYTQVRLQGLNPIFDPTFVVDSVVLALEYVGAYGPVSSQTFEVYRVDEQMGIDSTYYNFSSLDIQPTNLVETGFGTLQLNPNKLTVVGDDTLTSQLRIRLKNSVGTNLFNDRISGSYDAQFNDDNLFANEYFKGLYVKTNGVVSTSGSVGYFNLVDQDSKVIIYFTDASGQKTFDLRINSSCASFNHVEIDNSGKNVQNVIDNPNNGQTEFYAQSNRSRAIIDLPTVKNLPKNIIVHSAYLYLPIQHNQFSSYTPPGTITVLNAETKGLIGQTNYNSITAEYAVNLRAYLQQYVAGNVASVPIQISPSAFVSSVDRIVFNGQMTTNKKKPRLVISYTEF